MRGSELFCFLFMCVSLSSNFGEEASSPSFGLLVGETSVSFDDRRWKQEERVVRGQDLALLYHKTMLLRTSIILNLFKIDLPLRNQTIFAGSRSGPICILS